MCRRALVVPRSHHAPAGIVALLDHYEIPFAVPTFVWLAAVRRWPARSLTAAARDATVTIVIRALMTCLGPSRADILVVAIGRAGLVGLEHTSPAHLVSG